MSCPPHHFTPPRAPLRAESGTVSAGAWNTATPVKRWFPQTMTSPATVSIGGWDDGTVLIGVESSREPSAWHESARFTGVGMATPLT